MRCSLWDDEDTCLDAFIQPGDGFGLPASFDGEWYGVDFETAGGTPETDNMFILWCLIATGNPSHTVEAVATHRTDTSGLNTSNFRAFFGATSASSNGTGSSATLDRNNTAFNGLLFAPYPFGNDTQATMTLEQNDTAQSGNAQGVTCTNW